MEDLSRATGKQAPMLAKTSSLEEIVEEMIKKYPEMVREALHRAESSATAEVDEHQKAASGLSVTNLEPQAAVGEPSPKPMEQQHQAPSIPFHRYAAQFMVETQDERREVELAASQYMDGFNDGADWVFNDRRLGTVTEWEEEPPSTFQRPNSSPRAERPTSGPMIRGSVHAAGHATVNLATHHYPPVPQAKRLSYVMAKPVPVEAAQEEQRPTPLWTVRDPQASAPRYPGPASTAFYLPPSEFRCGETTGVNPYLHRGPAYSSIRGPGIRRQPLATRTRQGERLFRAVI